MLIYIINVLLIVLYGLVVNKENEKNRKIVTVLIAIQIFLISALRDYTVGTDIIGYLNTYNRFGNMGWNELNSTRMEFGYAFMNKLLFMISTNGRLLLIVVAIIVSISLGKFVYDYSRIPWLSFYLFACLEHFSTSLSALRMILSIAIILTSIKYVKERKLWKFLLCVIIAFLFHKTAIVIVLLYPLSRFKINHTYLVFSVFMIIGAYMLGHRITQYLIERFYVEYAAKELIISGQGKGMFLLLCLVLLLGLFLRTREMRNDDTMHVLFHMMILSIVFQSIAFSFSVFTRITTFFSISMIVFIPNVIYYITRNDVRLRIMVVSIVCLVTFGFYFTILTGPDTTGVVPYNFFW